MVQGPHNCINTRTWQSFRCTCPHQQTNMRCERGYDFVLAKAFSNDGAHIRRERGCDFLGRKHSQMGTAGLQKIEPFPLRTCISQSDVLASSSTIQHGSRTRFKTTTTKRLDVVDVLSWPRRLFLQTQTKFKHKVVQNFSSGEGSPDLHVSKHAMNHNTFEAYSGLSCRLCPVTSLQTETSLKGNIVENLSSGDVCAVDSGHGL